MSTHQRFDRYHAKGLFAMNKREFTVTGFVLQATHIALVLFLIIDVGFCEYENTWNFYYEQPCCSNSNSHHLRHHKGKY